MNIAYFTHYFCPEIGAPSARIYDLAQQWLSMGHRTQVVTCFPNHPSGKLYPGYKLALRMREQLDGIDVHRHWTYLAPNKGFVKKTLGHISYLPAAVLLSAGGLGDVDVAIGTSPTFFAAIAAAHFARRRKLPFIMEVRDLWPAVLAELGVLRNRHLLSWLGKLEMALYRRATRVVTVTQAFSHNLVERGVSAEKVATIPNGADVLFWSPTKPPVDLRRQLGLGRCFVVLYIGAHGISQGLGSILVAAKELSAVPDVCFLFVGEGAEKAQLEQQAAEERLSNVLFLEPVGKDMVKQFYATADACLVPLRDIPLFDGFVPSKMFEMMAMARPIVASVRGEAAEILQRSGGGLVVRPEDGRAVADALLSLCRQPHLARDMGRRGREFVIQNYSRNSLARTYADVMTAAIAQYHRE